jgi:hypothetical protein
MSGGARIGHGVAGLPDMAYPFEFSSKTNSGKTRRGLEKSIPFLYKEV